MTQARAPDLSHTCSLERGPSAAAPSDAHRAEDAAHQSKRARLESPEATSELNIESGTTRVRLWHRESGLVIKALANSIATGPEEEQQQQQQQPHESTTPTHSSTRSTRSNTTIQQSSTTLARQIGEAEQHGVAAAATEPSIRTALAPGEQQKQQTAAHPSCHR